MKNTPHFVFQKFQALKRRALHKKALVHSMLANSKIGKSVSALVFRARNISAGREQYFIAKNGKFIKTAENAIILHLYHIESWEEVFAHKLTKLVNRVKCDLYITLPEQNSGYISTIREVFPDANCLIVPNRGRDVLPFIKTAKILSDMGYNKVLKVHSKRSTHRETSNISDTAENGQSWLANVLDALIPEDEKIMSKMVRRINDKRTGIIGPLSYYYPLKMYLSHNRAMIERILGTTDRLTLNKTINDNNFNVGFFGGTMFWVDLETIRSVLKISKVNFPPEKGQTDGTTAHALERILCILSLTRGKRVIGIGATEIKELNYTDATMPDWYYEDVSGGKPPISIIVPVYADWRSLSKNIQSLKKTVGNSEDISVHYVNDCGPDVDDIEARIGQSIKGLTNFYYYRNKQNLGFVKTCNRAVLELVNQRDDALLLNSDTKVTRDFVFEMRKVLYSQPDIAAVTSRSNNATIWSVPMTGRLAYMRPASYLLYLFIRNRIPEKYITPTIHGFCVLIRRQVINEFGLFDEIYGRGYGEENDFAMRVQKEGWQCAVANKSFVFHYESKSFGNEARTRQIEMNEKILTERYPLYRQKVQEYWDSIKEPLK